MVLRPRLSSGVGAGGRQGGVAAIRSWVGCRRRLRRLGGGPCAARRLISALRAVWASAMRRLRTMMMLVVRSAIGVRVVRRHEPREMSLVAGSLMVALVRSEAVRRL